MKMIAYVKTKPTTFIANVWNDVQSNYQDQKASRQDTDKHTQILQIILEEMPNHINQKKRMDDAQRATDRIMKVIH